MADDDEIDILGDFSFNSCFAQNNQGIPSCSDREDTVHPQWLLDSMANNWYDIDKKNINSANMENNTSTNHVIYNKSQIWTSEERNLLKKEMLKYGRNVHKISQTIKTKSEAEIQALIEAEYGINLDTPSYSLHRNEDYEDIPTVAQEEIISDEAQISSVLNMVSTGSPTIPVVKTSIRENNYYKRKKTTKSLSKLAPDHEGKNASSIDTSEIIYDDDLIIGSTEFIGNDSVDVIPKNLTKYQRSRNEKKMRYRTKLSRNKRKTSFQVKRDPLITTQRQRGKHSEVPLDISLESKPKLQIVLGSGQAVPVSEGEQVIKLEKKKDSESESEIEIDVDSENEVNNVENVHKRQHSLVPVPARAVTVKPIDPRRKFEPMRRRQKKINLHGEGGCTIMHTEAGDLYEISSEPRKERRRNVPQPAVHLIPCRVYNSDKQAPYEVHMYVSTLINMDVHAHTSRGEVMGLLGGVYYEQQQASGEEVSDFKKHSILQMTAYAKASAAAAHTHCEMDPVSQALAAEQLNSRGLSVLGWHHSHPSFGASPSLVDLHTQLASQHALEREGGNPFVAVITSQHWPAGRTASHYRCFRVEESANDVVGYQFRVKLIPDITPNNLPRLIRDLCVSVSEPRESGSYRVNMMKDLCPQAGVTCLEKCVSSISHHMQSAGYSSSDALVKELLQEVRKFFR